MKNLFLFFFLFIPSFVIAQADTVYWSTIGVYANNGECLSNMSPDTPTKFYRCLGRALQQATQNPCSGDDYWDQTTGQCITPVDCEAQPLHADCAVSCPGICGGPGGLVGYGQSCPVEPFACDPGTGGGYTGTGFGDGETGGTGDTGDGNGSGDGGDPGTGDAGDGNGSGTSVGGGNGSGGTGEAGTGGGSSSSGGDSTGGGAPFSPEAGGNDCDDPNASRCGMEGQTVDCKSGYNTFTVGTTTSCIEAFSAGCNAGDLTSGCAVFCPSNTVANEGYVGYGQSCPTDQSSCGALCITSPTTPYNGTTQSDGSVTGTTGGNSTTITTNSTVNNNDGTNAATGACDPEGKGYLDCISPGEKEKPLHTQHTDIDSTLSRFMNRLADAPIMLSFSNIGNMISNGGNCPALDIDLGSTIINRHIVSTLHCDLSEVARPYLVGIMLFFYTLVGFRIIASS